MSSRLWGIWGRPWIDLRAVIDTACFAQLDREIALGLTEVEHRYTGGTLEWMGVVAPWMRGRYRDAMHAIEALSDDELDDFLARSELTTGIDRARARTLAYGDQTDFPLSRAQERLLAYRHGVYFPWKVGYHLLEDERWEDKHRGAGKTFGEEVRAVFPQTIAFIERLPFLEIGRAVIFGLEPHDHAPLHRDSEPGQALQLAQSISFAPRSGKRFYLQNAPDDPPEIIGAPIYWFNDADYHGVLADPFFRYSIRVDGVFDPQFLRELERHARGS